MRDPRAIAADLTPGHALFPETTQAVRNLLVQAIEADRAEQVPDLMNDARGTAYLDPGGQVYRHDGFVSDWSTTPVGKKPYLKVMLVTGGMTTASYLPEGSRVIWRPTDG